MASAFIVYCSGLLGRTTLRLSTPLIASSDRAVIVPVF